MVEIEYLNKRKSFENDINGFKLAKELFAEKNVVIAIKINEEIKDLGTYITTNCKVDFITTDSKEGLDIIRHSTAHLLAYAIKNLYKNSKLAIGPAVENGFYYDVDSDVSFSVDDFEKIEKEMNRIVKNDDKFIREEWSKEQAYKYFKEKGEVYKLDIIDSLNENEKISVYKLGDYVDLCRGPHVPSTRYLKNFKLTKVAGAYWKGDSNNKMLQRIYGTAWDSKENLDKYFAFLEEAEKRDHRTGKFNPM